VPPFYRCLCIGALSILCDWAHSKALPLYKRSVRKRRGEMARSQSIKMKECASVFSSVGVKCDLASIFRWEESMTKNAEDLSGDLAAIRQDLAHLAETISELVQNQTKVARVGVSDAVADARSKIANTAADTQNQVRAAGGEIEASIERNPLTAVLIAFGIGLSVGMITRSRG
jgi:ElaB/YqjD/DUF883 family membrane-anchored ribosome-binding protein